MGDGLFCDTCGKPITGVANTRAIWDGAETSDSWAWHPTCNPPPFPQDGPAERVGPGEWVDITDHVVDATVSPGRPPGTTGQGRDTEGGEG